MTRLSGAHIAAVAIGTWLDVYEVNNVVSQPYRANVVAVKRFDQLSNDTTGRKQIRDIICNSERIDVLRLWLRWSRINESIKELNKTEEAKNWPGPKTSSRKSNTVFGLLRGYGI